MKDKPRIVFLGTPEFAVAPLDALQGAGYEIAAAVTSPDQPAGRGQRLQQSAVKKYALGKGLRILQPAKLRDPEFIRALREINADLFIVVAFRMLPEIVWTLPPLGTFNLHASLLPQYRGAAPINHAIINGEKETGLTTFFLKQEIDTGEIILQEKISIGPGETAGELHDRMKPAGAALVLKTVQMIEQGNVRTMSQSELAGADGVLKTAPKLFREDCRIVWDNRTETIYNKVRGLSPYPAAFTTLVSPAGEEHVIKIFRTTPSTPSRDMAPGQIVTDGRQALGITAQNGTLYLEELQQAGKRIMPVGEFLRGFRINSDWKAG